MCQAQTMATGYLCGVGCDQGTCSDLYCCFFLHTFLDIQIFLDRDFLQNKKNSDKYYNSVQNGSCVDKNKAKAFADNQLATFSLIPNS